MFHIIKPVQGSRKAHRRVGRGNGSGRGTFSGHGCKGEQARAGRGKAAPFEGGQTPLVRRQPKLGGFKNPTRKEYEVVNCDSLEAHLEPGTYDVEGLKEARLVDGKRPVKLLARGKLTKKFSLTVNAASKSAKDAVAKVGGSVTIA